jgi:hypothetical protein
VLDLVLQAEFVAEETLVGREIDAVEPRLQLCEFRPVEVGADPGQVFFVKEEAARSLTG